MTELDDVCFTNLLSLFPTTSVYHNGRIIPGRGECMTSALMDWICVIKRNVRHGYNKYYDLTLEDPRVPNRDDFQSLCFSPASKAKFRK